jgi:hypothetical protein
MIKLPRYDSEIEQNAAAFCFVIEVTGRRVEDNIGKLSNNLFDRIKVTDYPKFNNEYVSFEKAGKL